MRITGPAGHVESAWFASVQELHNEYSSGIWSGSVGSRGEYADTTPIIRNAYMSRTVSEFWRRYNYRMHDFLYRNVFEATGGRRAPVRSMLLVFLVSGLFHELTFALATSRLTGYQFVFFTIQGTASLASGRLERVARHGGIAGKVTAHGATILFVAVTSVLFFDGVSKSFPFDYACQCPLP